MWFEFCKDSWQKVLDFSYCTCMFDSSIDALQTNNIIFPFIQGVILGLIFLDETDNVGQRVIRRDTMTFPARAGDKNKTSGATNVSMFNLTWHFLIVAIIANIIMK